LSLLDSLLDAIVRLGGDALVMHVGERPYVVTTSRSLDDFRGPLSWGQVELSSRPLTPEAVLSMLGQMLPPDVWQTLDEVGAIEHEIDAPDGQHRFVVIAARGGDDVWVEVRKKVDPPPVVEPEPEPVPEPMPEPVAAEAPVMAAEPESAPVPMVYETPAEVAAEAPPATEMAESAASASADEPAVEAPAIAERAAPDVPEYEVQGQPVEEPVVVFASPVTLLIDEEPAATDADPGESADEVTLTFDHPLVAAQEAGLAEPAVELEAGDLTEEEWFSIQAPPRTEAVARPEPSAEAEPEPVESHQAGPTAHQIAVEMPEALALEEPAAEVEPVPVAEVEPEPVAEAEPIPEPVAEAEPIPEPVAEAEPIPEPVAEAEPIPEPVAEAEPIPVGAPAVPVMRFQPRDPAPAHASTSAVADVLRDGLERGASTVYAIGGSRPLMRIEGDITSSASLPVLQAADIDRFAYEFAPRGEVAHSTSEWTTTVPGAGRVRCVSFEDAAGRGLVFHLAANISSADELGLSREVQALCNEPDGLVIVAGSRASGKSTLLAAFVDRINRSRADHIITIESRVRTLHERRHSLISQREVDGDGLAIARAARAALREGPDVLVIDDARAPETIAVAIDAARAGRLVFASLPAPSTSAAIERLTDAFAVDRRPQVRALLSGALRAVISQVLVHKTAGGRVAAREVLLSSPPSVQLILDGSYAQVPVAIESGRRLGMRTLTDSLVALVRDGVIEADEALRAAPERPVLIAALRQEGMDVSELERWA
jgi:twitching motility protein PilT